MYEYWYDYAKPKYEDKTKLCYTDIVYKKYEDVYADLAGDTKKSWKFRDHYS